MVDSNLRQVARNFAAKICGNVPLVRRTKEAIWTALERAGFTDGHSTESRDEAKHVESHVYRARKVENYGGGVTVRGIYVKIGRAVRYPESTRSRGIQQGKEAGGSTSER